MQKLIFLLLFGFLSSTMIAQSTTSSSKSEDVKVEQSVKKCSSSAEAKKCCSKDEKAKCSSAEKAKCSKEGNKEASAKKCSKGDACCSKTGKKVADCDNKKQGCCSSKQNPTK